MSEQDDGIITRSEPVANGEDTAPAAGLISQYVKDFSFENPNAPAIYQNPQGPAIDVQFNIASSQVAEEVFEIVLRIEVKAETEGKVAFLVDLSYAGLFGLRNIPEEAMGPVLLVEAPRLIFPYARQIVSEAVTNAGFPPLLLDPIDFGQAYVAQLEAAQAQQAETADTETPAEPTSDA